MVCQYSVLHVCVLQLFLFLFHVDVIHDVATS